MPEIPTKNRLSVLTYAAALLIIKGADAKRCESGTKMAMVAQGKRFGSHGRKLAGAGQFRTGFTLIELLVVLSIMSLLMAILLPALGKVRQQARRALGVSNLRQITAAVDLFSCDNGERYPPSVAKIGFGDNWLWQEPTVLTAYTKRTPSGHRSVSAYLHDYLPDADVLFCPNAPAKYPYLQQAWDAGDDWDCPSIEPLPDVMLGVYCLYWNYTGYLGRAERHFHGPTGPARGYRQSSIVVTEYLGYGHWRSPRSFGSCERFHDAEVASGSQVSSDFWALPGHGTQRELAALDVKLHAGYVDGHVESYSPGDTVPMSLIGNVETGEPFSGPAPSGFFYLPHVGLR
jgi:prepilin-type N-terminal cleavage/methylation domain-containing protein